MDGSDSDLKGGENMKIEFEGENIKSILNKMVDMLGDLGVRLVNGKETGDGAGTADRGDNAEVRR